MRTSHHAAVAPTINQDTATQNEHRHSSRVRRHDVTLVTLEFIFVLLCMGKMPIGLIGFYCCSTSNAHWEKNWHSSIVPVWYPVLVMHLCCATSATSAAAGACRVTHAIMHVLQANLMKSSVFFFSFFLLSFPLDGSHTSRFRWQSGESQLEPLC